MYFFAQFCLARGHFEKKKAWGEAKQWIASKLTENVRTQKRGARFSAPAQSQHHA